MHGRRWWFFLRLGWIASFLRARHPFRTGRSPAPAAANRRRASVPARVTGTPRTTPAVSPFPELSADSGWRYNLSALEEMLDEPVQPGRLPDGSLKPSIPAEDPVRVAGQIKELTHIPVLKSVSRNFQMASRSTEASLEELAQLVAQDPGLHTKILRMVNSAFFRFEREITDIEHAMVLLGLDRIRFLAQTLGAVKELNSFSAGFDLRHLWSHSFACGLLAEELARLLNLTELDHAYSAGLLHDVGKIILSSLYPDSYRALLRQSHGPGFNLSRAEGRIFGHDHEAAGRLFAESQKLPQAIIEAMSHHGSPVAAPDGERDTVCVLFLANDFAKRLCLGFSGNPVMASDADLIDALAMLSSPPPGSEAGGVGGERALSRIRDGVGRALPAIRRQVDDLLLLTFGRKAPDSLLSA